jgi:hypothetical protein
MEVADQSGIYFVEMAVESSYYWPQLDIRHHGAFCEISMSIWQGLPNLLWMSRLEASQ